MKRGASGEYQVRSVGGKEVRDFIPHPLPPSPPVGLSGPENWLPVDVVVDEGVRQTGLTFPAVAKSLDTLLRLGIVRGITGRQRNRAFVYDRYLCILSEGTEAL